MSVTLFQVVWQNTHAFFEPWARWIFVAGFSPQVILASINCIGYTKIAHHSGSGQSLFLYISLPVWSLALCLRHRLPLAN